MPDWMQLVRERLGALGIAPQLEEEVVAELANHLEDHRTLAVIEGMTEPEAVALALEGVPDWVALNREIAAAKKEGPMNDRTKMLWMPGMTMLISASILMSVTLRLLPSYWITPQTPVFIGAFWLLLYVALGTVGAQWSRRAGGDVTTRVLAGIFPLALHVAIFLCVFVATALQSHPRTPEWKDPGFLLKVLFMFIVLPAIALSVGTIPFLRKPRETAPSRA